MRHLATGLALAMLATVLGACSGDDRTEAGSTAGGSGDGGAGGVGSTTMLGPTELFPLTVGNTWSYQLHVLTGNLYCMEDEIRDRTVLSMGPFEDKSAFLVQDSTGGCTDRTELHFAIEGNEIFEWIPNAWFRSLAAPLSPNTTWIGATTHGWMERGQMTVTAGTFDDCWERTSSDPLEPSIVYCKGIGPIAESSVMYTAELLDFSAAN